MKTTSNKVLKAAAIASLLAGSAIDNNFNQVAIMKEHTNDETVNYTDKTIQAAIVNNIDTAINDHSLDDIGDIVKSLQSGGSSALD
jgi:hypothetical protein